MKKYFGIEILRFLTSLAVLFYHYRHFFNPFNSDSVLKYNAAKTDLPFINLLNVFYENGILEFKCFTLFQDLFLLIFIIIFTKLLLIKLFS